MSYRISDALISEENARLAAALDEDYAALGRHLDRGGVDIDAVTAKVAAFAVAVPTWGVGTGGTRFARFPGPGEPRGIFEKLEDCAAIHQLTRATPTGSPHFPWDKVSDYRELAERAKALGLGFDAVNSNTFQDQPGQALQLQMRLADPQPTGGARSGDRAQHRMHRDRREARLEGAHGLDRRRHQLPRAAEPDPRPSIAISSRCSADLRGAAGRLADASRAQALRAGVLLDGHLGLGHEPSWPPSSSGPKAHCLVDLGHHAPNVNIEQIVARLHPVRKARRLPFQRLEIWRRRPRRRLDQSASAVPGLQRAGRSRAQPRGRRLRSRLHDRPVAQRHRPDREPDVVRHGGQRAYAQALLVDRGALERRRRPTT